VRAWIFGRKWKTASFAMHGLGGRINSNFFSIFLLQKLAGNTHAHEVEYIARGRKSSSFGPLLNDRIGACQVKSKKRFLLNEIDRDAGCRPAVNAKHVSVYLRAPKSNDQHAAAAAV
jgi:hypothetical protein